MNALLRDAHNRKLVSIVAVHALAAAYEEKIAALAKGERPQGQRRGNGGGTAAQGRSGGLGQAGPPEPRRKRKPGTLPTRVNVPSSGVRPGRTAKNLTQKAESARKARDSRRRRQQVNQWMALSGRRLGGDSKTPVGRKPLTGWFVRHVRDCALSKKTKNIHLEKDIVKQLLDEPRLGASIVKEADKRRRAPLSKWMHVHLSGATHSPQQD